jgi:chromosome segregation ATPase
MSDSGSRVANPADLRDASRERLLAEIGLLQHQYDIGPAKLQEQIAKLQMEILQARDYARGCAAELGEAKASINLTRRQLRQARKEIADLHASRTWKLARFIMLPARIARRVLKVG